MAKFRLSAIAMGVVMSAMFAGNAAAIGNKADCEYEGGEAFDLPNEAQVCVIQVRPEKYHGEEYDGNQLGVKVCEGDMIGDDLFCKITLKEGKKIMPKPDAETASDDTKPSMPDAAKKEMAKEAKKAAKKAAK